MSEFISTREMHRRLYEIRTALNLSQRAMAKKMGYSNSFYNKIESHEDAEISLRTVMAICHTFNVNYDYLVHGEGPMFNEEDIQAQDVISRYQALSEPYKRCLREYLAFLSLRSEMDREGEK